MFLTLGCSERGICGAANVAVRPESVKREWTVRARTSQFTPTVTAKLVIELIFERGSRL